jgi:hypothetical protein
LDSNHLSRSDSESVVLSFGARVRYDGLLVSAPSNQIWTKEDSKPTSRATIINVANPVSIGKGAEKHRLTLMNLDSKAVTSYP